VDIGVPPKLNLSVLYHTTALKAIKNTKLSKKFRNVSKDEKPEIVKHTKMQQESCVKITEYCKNKIIS
jgi:hypothetical protein